VDEAAALAGLWEFFQQTLFRTPSSLGERPLFNPYWGVEPEVDRDDADRIRQANLEAYLASFPCRPETLAVGESPGWRGCRFSGVPFTSEAQLAGGELPYRGSTTSRFGAPVSEASATIFWRVMKPYHPRFIVWNCLPLHPHLSGKPLSNRRPTASEIQRFSESLWAVIELIQPDRIIAIGRTAQGTLEKAGIKPLKVRHPSHGGATEFQESMTAVMNGSSADHRGAYN
jgi:uracil-DNA glycosylase